MSRTSHPITGLFADHLHEQPESYLWFKRSSFGSNSLSFGGPDFSFEFSARHWRQNEPGRPIMVTTLLRICEALEVKLTSFGACKLSSSQLSGNTLLVYKRRRIDKVNYHENGDRTQRTYARSATLAELCLKLDGAEAGY